MTEPPPLVAESVEPRTADRLEPPAEDRLPGPGTAVHWTLLALSAAVLLLSAVLRVRDETQVVVPLAGLALPEMCAMRRFAGMDCPGCGLTRCFIRLAHGDLRGAWMYNPAGIPLFAVVVFQLPYRLFQIARLRRGRDEHRFTSGDEWVLISLSLLLIGQWCVRTIW